MDRILITGAAGRLGTALRKNLAGFVPNIRLSDIVEMKVERPGEEIVQCDLSDADAVLELVKDCDAIVHLGGKPNECSFEDILQINIRGTYNIFEAARKSNKPRILYASSNHVNGFYNREELLDGNTLQRPDSLYGLSKCFGENLGSLYWDKFGVENVCVRIGSCFEEVANRRMLATWLSPDDFGRLVKVVFGAPRVAHTIVYGVSDNREKWWDNSHAAFLGWEPQDSAEDYRSELEASTPVPDPKDPAVVFQGAGLAVLGHFED